MSSLSNFQNSTGLEILQDVEETQMFLNLTKIGDSFNIINVKYLKLTEAGQVWDPPLHIG